MAEMNGREASIRKSSVTVAYLQEWTLDIALNAEETTEFADDWKNFVGGMVEWSGSVSGNFDPSNTQQKAIHDALLTAAPTGALTDLRFYMDGTHYWSGSVIITGVAVNITVSGLVKITINFQGNGVLAYN